MKNWMKVGLGLLAGGLVGAGVAFLGKKDNGDDEYYVEVDAESDDSESSDEE